ncbi:MAG: hypothetical protein J6R59_01775 [Paludibacteraceae bacterium]|nr:hypothetical protein [Paludibacteraceae bacterium]
MLIKWNSYKRNFQHLGSMVDLNCLPQPCISVEFVIGENGLPTKLRELANYYIG